MNFFKKIVLSLGLSVVAVTAFANQKNAGRALLLLHKANLITLKPEVNHYDSLTDRLPTVRDIMSNPKNLKIKELEAVKLSGIIRITEFIVLNGNFFL